MVDFKKIAAGIGLTIVGIVTGNPYLVLGGLGLTQQGLFTPQGIKSRQEGVLAQGVDTQNPIPIVYGTARVGPWIVFQDTRDTSNGPNHRADIVAAFCLGNRKAQPGENPDPDNGEILGFGSVFFDEHHAFDDLGQEMDFLKGLGTLLHEAGEPGVDPSEAHAHMHAHLGAHDQAADDYMVATAAITGDNAWRGEGSTWTVDHRLQGIAYIVFELRYSRRIFPGNVPQITAMVRARKLYDPRDGGWYYSTNWALCVRDYLLDGISGGALLLNQIDEESFKHMADVSGQSRPELLNIFPQYTVNGVVDTSQGVLQNIQELLFTAGGFLIPEGGKFRLKILDPAAPLSDFKLDESNIRGDWSLSVNDPAERLNRVIVKHPEGAAFNATTPLDQVQEVQYPAIGAPNAYLDADGGFDVPSEIECPFIAFRTPAQLRGKLHLEQSRNDLQVALVASEEALVLSFGDKVLLSHRDITIQEKECFVVGVGINTDADHTLTLALREVERGQGLPVFAGGAGSPLISFLGTYCEVEHGAQQDPPSGNSTIESGVLVSWGTFPGEDDTHTDWAIEIRRGTCENFDPMNAMPGAGFDCGNDRSFDAIESTPRPWRDDYMGAGMGSQCSSLQCSLTPLPARWYKARFRWTNPVTGGTEHGPWSNPIEGPAPPDTEASSDFGSDPNYCVI